jgi:hypothetical protein
MMMMMRIFVSQRLNDTTQSYIPSANYSDTGSDSGLFRFAQYSGNDYSIPR